MSRDSSVGIATGYRLDGWARDVSLLHSIQTVWGPIRPPIQWVPGVKRPDRGADYSPPYSAEVKNGGAVPPLPHRSSWRDA
jgi:hypothetical protein